MDNSSPSKDLSEEKLTRFATDKQVSPGELEALKLALLQKVKSKEIAASLDISEAAARKRLGEVYRKFDIQGRGPGKLASLKAMLMSADERDRNQGQMDKVAISDSLNEAPTIDGFVGRKVPLAALERWILSPVKGHKLLAISGTGGIGKTSLARKLVETVGGHFQTVVWMSIDPSKSPVEQLSKLLSGLRAAQSSSSPASDSIASNDITRINDDPKPQPAQLIKQVMAQLSARRCLVVLDGYERLFISQHKAVGVEKTEDLPDLPLSIVYRPGFEVYGQMLDAIASRTRAAHSSCVVLTSREKPREVMTEGDAGAVRLYKLGGLDDAEAEELISGFNLKDPAARQKLIERYCGHPMALRFAANTIKDDFFGSIQNFLDHKNFCFQQS